MKKYYFLTILCIATALSAAAITKIEITQSNLSRLVANNSYFIIRDSISLSGKHITIGQNSLLNFDGGRFSDGTIDLNGATICASDYCIFDGTEIRTSSGDPCSFGNAEVSALWFKQIGPDDDIAPVVNHALATAPGCVVSLGGGTYTLRSPIVMDVEGQSLRHAGTLKVVGDIPAVRLHNSSITLNLHNIESATIPVNPNLYTGTGIEFSGNVKASDIRFDKIDGMKYGLAFIPDLGCGTEETNIDFMEISAKYGIYFNLESFSFTENPARQSASAYAPGTWCRNIMLFGGVINAPYGIYCDDKCSPSSGIIKSKDMSGNVFSNITIGDCTSLPIRLRGLTYAQFPYLKFDDTAKNCSNWIDIARSEDLHFNILEELPYDKVLAGSNVNVAAFEAPITGAYISPTRYLNRMFILSDTQNSNISTKYLTSDVASFNMVKTLTYPNSAINQNHSITLNHLLVNASETETIKKLTDGSDTGSFATKVLSDICVLNIGKRQHLTLDLTASQNIPNASITLVLNITLGGIAEYKWLKNGLPTTLGSGTYRITWDKDSNPQVVKIG